MVSCNRLCFDSCNQPCVRKHRDTEYFTVYVCVNSYCSITSWRLWLPGWLFVQLFLKIRYLHRNEVTLEWVIGHFYHQGLKETLFCHHRNINWPPMPPKTIKITASGHPALERHFVVAQKVAYHATVLPGVHWSQILLRFVRHLPPSAQMGSSDSLCRSPAHGLLLFVCFSSVCLHVNNFNTILPHMHRPDLLSLVWDDGTKTLSSNRWRYTVVCLHCLVLASPQLQYRTQSASASFVCDLWNTVGLLFIFISVGNHLFFLILPCPSASLQACFLTPSLLCHPAALFGCRSVI